MNFSGDRGVRRIPWAPFLYRWVKPFAKAERKLNYLSCVHCPATCSFYGSTAPRLVCQKHPFEELSRGARELNMGIVITDTSGRRDCAHMHPDRAKDMVMLANSLHPTDYTRIDAWGNGWNTGWIRGVQNCTFYAHARWSHFAGADRVYWWISWMRLPASILSSRSLYHSRVGLFG